MMTTRKNKLLIAAAVAALMTGSGFALAQGAPDAGTKANPAAKSAPAEKMAPGAAEHKAPGAANKGAQKSEDKSLPSKRQSQSAPANKSKSETTGQAPANERSKSESTKSDSTKSESTKSDSAQPSSRSTQDKTNTDTSRPNQSSQSNQPNTNQNRGAAGTTTSNTNVSVNLSPEQRSKIHQVIVSDRNAPRVTNVDFQLNVGARVPRDKVKLARVPSTIVEIQPAWRDFEYFLVGDQIVIVNPRTLEIVAVVPA
jgi:hypothetical protein